MDDLNLWPIVVYFATVVVIVGGMVGVSALLGQRHDEHATHEQYESGIAATGDARVRFSAHFYLIAVFFVIFDLEAAFVYAWAVSAREVGWPGYVELVVFVAILGAALVYLWRVRGLDVMARGLRPRHHGEEKV